MACLLAFAEQQTTAGKNATTSETDYKQLAQLHEVTGKLVSAAPTDKTLTLQVEYQLLQPRSKEALKSADAQALKLYREQERIINEEKKVLKARNPVQAARQLQQLQRHALRIGTTANKVYANAFTLITYRKQFDLQATDNVKVRLSKLPAEYDDKGFPKKYTDAELKERKGPDPGQPGYAGSFEELTPGQIVKLTFAADKKDAKDMEAKDDHPHIARILVIGESNPPVPAASDKKKK
jgi:hypothetical protein